MIRAFVGVKIDPPVVERISLTISELKPHLAGLRWVAEENLHFTLKFLGYIGEERIEPIATALKTALQPFPQFTINAKGLGVFPDFRRARVLWIGVDSDSLRMLASGVETALERLGFAREKRSFEPHITLGRWRAFEGSHKALEKQLQKWQSFEFGRSEVREVIVFQSVLGREGARYHPLRVLALNNEPGS